MRGWIVALVVGVALGGFGLYGVSQRRQGALREQIAGLERQADSLRHREPGLETLYVHRTDTLRLTRRITDSILAIDTLIRTDTVRAIVRAERAACDAVIVTCEDQKALLRQMNVNLSDRLRLEKKRRPSWLSRTAGKVVWAGIGFGAGRLRR